MTLITALPDLDQLQIRGRGNAASAFAVSDLACLSIGAVGLELAALLQWLGAKPTPVTVDRPLANHWFKYSFRPSGWKLPNLWDDIAGIYQSKDGWIRLHTNLPHHKQAALLVLGCAASKAAVSAAVATWDADRLEADIHAAGGVAAALRSSAEWLDHPQGHALTQEPLIAWQNPREITLRTRPEASPVHPLKGLRVLDLTRVLAGPVASRTLAGLGAEVLRIDPPGWDEPGVLQDIALGKRMATLDLKSTAGRDRLAALMEHADVVVHGYRPGALDGLGFDLQTRDTCAPNRIEVSLNAYGWSGPWAQRRGFDSLVQLSTGIAEAGQRWAKTDTPHPLPYQALDHATGYLMAAAVLSALNTAAKGLPVANAHLSLARTALSLQQLPVNGDQAPLAAPDDADFSTNLEQSAWGPGHRLKSPLFVGETALQWARPARESGSDAPEWQSELR